MMIIFFREGLMQRLEPCFYQLHVWIINSLHVPSDKVYWGKVFIFSFYPCKAQTGNFLSHCLHYCYYMSSLLQWKIFYLMRHFQPLKFKDWLWKEGTVLSLCKYLEFTVVRLRLIIWFDVAGVNLSDAQ